MGIEMRLHLIDEESLNFLLNLHWNEMYVQLEKGLLREKRPPKTPSYLVHSILMLNQISLTSWTKLPVRVV